MAVSRARAEQDGQLGGGAPELRDKQKTDWADVEGQELTVKQIVNTTDADGQALVAVVFEENPSMFFWCGTVIRNWVDFYGEEFIGTVIKVGGLTKTKKGQTCRAFEII